ncbi:hypothetical protein IMCC12053_1609 [Celeribacter marinus]|uniref:Uncharacterized protein n=1 Tax=Celeribacter marinus TaxID=1397108 RepID=A0A0P0ABX1_9RHOB|nr:hypothetical protein IMCC12053_1609 [Celeribacter marinus]
MSDIDVSFGPDVVHCVSGVNQNLGMGSIIFPYDPLRGKGRYEEFDRYIRE